MKLKELKPRKALNKAFLKVKPNRNDIVRFKANLIQLLDRTNDTESEEFHKNLVSDFLKKTYYDPAYFINTKGRKDLVIHNGNSAGTAVGVIIEAKKPTNKSEMVTTEKLNVKAFQELMLYYLQERIIHKNLEIKHLAITNINEWLIFDATVFERLFAQNKNLVKQFTDFESERLSGIKTDFFYRQIAEPFLETIQQEIEFTYFDIRDYQKALRNANKADDNQLIALFKLLSPEHLLKLPFTNDSNSLDKRFYTELLHIIGLSETKEGSKKLIARNKEGERNSGAILEDAIIQLDSLDKINRLDNPNHFGATYEERLFNVALELSITWINRILFLKLLEAQLISYHKGDDSYSFLNLSKIKNFDDLNSLFFQVLARRFEERNPDVKNAFEKVPYLNSSLFEPTEIEQVTLFISNLKDNKTIPILPSTVLKNEQGKKRTGNLPTLQYLFEFLNAYDFSSEGSEEIQEDNKTLINASVLGLIFEKINGYKEGSFFTPGFITMYMCHETIRKAVIQKFRDYCLNHDLQDFKIDRIEEIYDLIPKLISRKKANEIINSIKICDPAVGSGHFLVSALNEMISVKNDLKILEDKNGKSLNRYEIQVVSDELIITDEEGEFFEYHPNNPESRRIQETLFHEKQTIIENCLFGVDINPNSVKICRLRLWIELLKNAYYRASPSPSRGGELETLPNIDINIKCGNSLVSRFALDADLKQALQGRKWNIDSYRIAVATYRNAKSKEEKREMERLILSIKQTFSSSIRMNDPIKKRLDKIAGELYHRFTGTFLFEPEEPYGKNEKKHEKKRQEEQGKLEKEIAMLTVKMEEIKNNKIYENSFEWRFEFPEVLDDDGNFVGFDVIIGNPPYGVNISEDEKDILKKKYAEYHTRWTDTFNYFIGLGLELVQLNGIMTLIIPNNFLYQNEYEKSRTKILNSFKLLESVNLGDNVFADANVPTAIISVCAKTEDAYAFTFYDLRNKEKDQKLFSDNKHAININRKEVVKSSNSAIGITEESSKIFQKIYDNSILLGKIAFEVANGIQPTGDKIFRIDHETIEKYSIESSILKPVLVGGDFQKYSKPQSDKFVIYTNKETDPLTISNTISYLSNFREKLSMKRETKKGTLPWWSLHWPRYKALFENPKIVLRQTSDKIIATYDDQNFYAMNNVIIIQLNEDAKLSSKYLLSLLNSKLIDFIYQFIAQEKGRAFAEVKPINIRKLPIKIADQQTQFHLEELVNTIFLLEEENNKSSSVRNEIDQIIYQLYNLTEEEIAIVEKDSK